MDFNPEYVLQLVNLIKQLEKKVITITQYDQSVKDLRERSNI